MITNMNNLTIEWWMLDGLVGLIILIAVIRGLIKGIGDAVLRLAGLAGGIALCVFYSNRVSEFLASTSLRTILYDNIYRILLPGTQSAAGQGVDPTGEQISEMVNPSTADPLTEAMPKTLGGIIASITDKAVDTAADKLTEVAISIFSVVVIMLAVWLVLCIVRMIYKHLRKQSFVLGFVDRLLGMVLGIIRGLVISCIAIAALIPVVTIFAPDKVPEIIQAMEGTYVAGIIYDINPLMFLIKYVIG